MTQRSAKSKQRWSNAHMKRPSMVAIRAAAAMALALASGGPAIRTPEDRPGTSESLEKARKKRDAERFISKFYAGGGSWVEPAANGGVVRKRAIARARYRKARGGRAGLPKAAFRGR